MVNPTAKARYDFPKTCDHQYFLTTINAAIKEISGFITEMSSTK